MKARKKWIVSLLIVVGLIVTGYFAAVQALNRFLEDGALNRLIGRKTTVILDADAGYLPLIWRGMSVRSDGLLVRGKPPRSLTEIQVSDLRAYCSLRDLWQRKWTIKRLQASRLEAAFGQAAAGQLEKILPRDPELQPQIDTKSPVKLEIRETFIPVTDIIWGEQPEAVGYLKGVESRFNTRGHDLDIVGRGGTFRQTGWPELKVADLRLYYARPKLTVLSATFSLGQPQNISVTGELDFGPQGGMLWHIKSATTPVERFLSGFWRGRFEGNFDSECNLEKVFQTEAKMTAIGELHFTRATIHDVPTLKQIAAATQHPQFEKPKIEILRGRYSWNGTRMDVAGFEIEAKGLFRVQGEFSIEKENIEGKFRIGVAPDVAESIPGAREKVFTESRDGYLWTTMTLSGPVQHPREDLKERLVAAAQEHFAKGIFSRIFKPGKQVLELLNAIYQ